MPVDMWTIGWRRPAPPPPLPEQARKAGKCSPSPTYPPAQQQQQDLLMIILKESVDRSWSSRTTPPCSVWILTTVHSGNFKPLALRQIQTAADTLCRAGSLLACSQCHHDEQRVRLARRLPTWPGRALASLCGLTGGDQRLRRERPSPSGTAVRIRYLLCGIIALVRTGAVVQGKAKPKEHQQHGKFGEPGRHRFRQHCAPPRRTLAGKPRAILFECSLTREPAARQCDPCAIATWTSCPSQ
jgi:hypothetical protein